MLASQERPWLLVNWVPFTILALTRPLWLLCECSHLHKDSGRPMWYWEAKNEMVEKSSRERIVESSTLHIRWPALSLFKLSIFESKAVVS